MATRTLRQGTITRLSRAYQQDLELVMGTDPIRAILELVTNSDDAYEDLPSGPRCKITIDVTRRRGQPDLISVKDRANSMSLSEAELYLGQEGGRTSGFERGEDRRGLLGRGAKDIVHFGPTEWDLVTPEGEHSIFRLLYEDRPTQTWESEALDRTQRRLHGTTVNLELQQRFRLPTHDNLLRLLSRHFGMRQILLDDNRDIRLIDRTSGSSDRIIYQPPQGTELAFNERIPITGYPGQFATINLYESDASLDDGETTEYWRHSLAVSSGRSTYDVFIGKFKREPWAPFLGRIFGSIDTPYINQLIREYDDCQEREEEPSSANPISLVKRDRTGLVRRTEHPFLNAFYSTVEEFLQPHLERIRTESQSGRGAINENTRRRNRNLGNLFGRLLEEEDSPVDGDGDSGGRLPPIGLSMIPATRIVDPLRHASLTVRYRHDPESIPIRGEPVVNVSIINEDSSSDSFSLNLIERAGYHSRAVSVGPREDGDISEVKVSCMGLEESSVVEWQERLLPEISELEFENNSYSLKETTNKSIKLLIPWDLISESDAIPDVTISGSPNISLIQSSGLVQPDDRRDCAYTRIIVMGRGVGSTSQLRAVVGNVSATANLTVTSSGARNVRIVYEELDISQRAYFSEDGSILTVNASDPSIKRYLGEREDGWPGQDDLHFRTMLAEIATHTLSRFVISNRHQQERADPYRLFQEHMVLMENWLPRVHRVLIPNNEIGN